MEHELLLHDTSGLAARARVVVPDGWTATEAGPGRVILLPADPRAHTQQGFTANLVATLHPVDEPDDTPKALVEPLVLSAQHAGEVRSIVVSVDRGATCEVVQLVDQRTRGAARLSIVASCAANGWDDVAELFDSVSDGSSLELTGTEHAA